MCHAAARGSIVGVQAMGERNTQENEAHWLYAMIEGGKADAD